jgi:DNA-nicking Smr family endonuclease
MKELDLHGMTHEEALLSAEDFVMKESLKEVFQCRLITGNSMKLQTRIIDELLKPHGFKWYIPAWNTGEIIVME